MMLSSSSFRLTAQTKTRRNMSSISHHFKLVVVGAGPGGLSVASRFCKELPEKCVAIVEPNKVSDIELLLHYFIPS